MHSPTVKINAFLHFSMQTARLRKNKGLEILSGEHVAMQKSQGDSSSLVPCQVDFCREC